MELSFARSLQLCRAVSIASLLLGGHEAVYIRGSGAKSCINLLGCDRLGCNRCICKEIVEDCSQRDIAISMGRNPTGERYDAYGQGIYSISCTLWPDVVCCTATAVRSLRH